MIGRIIKKPIWKKVPFLILLVLFLIIYIQNAWVVDDAYITFRTIDNFVRGYGLTWNINERVQAYTHPLWMFLISLFYSLTREAFFTSLSISFAFSLGAILVAYFAFIRQKPVLWWKPALLVLVLLASKAFIDYSSSGLENPLSYFLTALYLAIFLLDSRPVKDFRKRDVFLLFLIASLGFINRMDTGLLYLPSLIYVAVSQIQKNGWKIILVILAGISPAVVWLLFSLVYYGFLFPNTVYAKSVSGILLTEKIKRGIDYLKNSLAWDTFSHLALPAVVICGIAQRRFRTLAVVAGVASYFVYIVLNAASATHMSGRFFALPFFFLLLVLVELISSKRMAFVIALIAIAYIIWNPISPIKMGTPLYRPFLKNQNFIDTNLAVHNQGAALLNYQVGREMPLHEWYIAGLAFRNDPDRISVGGPGGIEAIGYFAYAAGQEKIIVDYLGLADPLLARLPICNTRSWKSGHFYRVPPDGYIQSLQTGENQIIDPGVHAYYDALKEITRSPIFKKERWKAIIKMNLGGYQDLLGNYRSWLITTFAGKGCNKYIREKAGLFP